MHKVRCAVCCKEGPTANILPHIALANEVAVVEPARLITLLEDCIKWQQHQGLLPLDTEFDLFRGSDQLQAKEDDLFTNHIYNTIKVYKR